MKYHTSGMADAGIAIIVGLFIGTVAAQLTNNPQKSVAAPQKFDHSNCQYPERWTNPPDSCDNSDPAVPECIQQMYSKKAEDACIAAFVAEHQPQPKPVKKPKPAQPKPPVQCGGK